MAEAMALAQPSWADRRYGLPFGPVVLNQSGASRTLTK
jgi:hypothetical protein